MLKMRSDAVFFGVRGRNAICQVYSPEILERLKREVNLHEITIDKGNLQEHAELLKPVEYVFSTWGMPAFSEEEITTYMPNLKVLFYAAGSVQAFARPFLRCGKMVLSAAAANGVPVAEFALAQILLANKGFYQSTVKMKKDRAAASSFCRHFPGNYRVKVGLLGFGVIGSKVAELLKPFNVEVFVFDPFLSEERAGQCGVRKADLTEIFSTCQTISNHLADKDEIAGLLNKRYFDLMGSHATFINTGRGRQVVERDLADALREVPTRTAVLDVTVREPLEPDSPLLELDNVFLTPHIAGSMGHEVWRMAEFMIEDLIRIQNGETPKYNVTLEMLETMA